MRLDVHHANEHDVGLSMALMQPHASCQRALAQTRQDWHLKTQRLRDEDQALVRLQAWQSGS